jgi:hypothetical protein
MATILAYVAFRVKIKFLINPQKVDKYIFYIPKRIEEMKGLKERGDYRRLV